MKKLIFSALFICTLALGAYFTAQVVNSNSVTAKACDSEYCS